MVVREGSNVTLKCAATGSPEPAIIWRRENGVAIELANGTEGKSSTIFFFFVFGLSLLYCLFVCFLVYKQKMLHTTRIKHFLLKQQHKQNRMLSV